MKNPSETEDLEKEVLIKSTILKLLPRNIRGFVCAIVVINNYDHQTFVFKCYPQKWGSHT